MKIQGYALKHTEVVSCPIQIKTRSKGSQCRHKPTIVYFTILSNLSRIVHEIAMIRDC